MTIGKKIVINVIGAGRWGPNLVRNFSNSLHCRVGVICDLDEEKLQNLAPRFPGVRLTKNTEETTTDSLADALAIITPVSTHYSLSKRALLASKDVFVEKPLALSVEQCEELAKLAKQRERILMVGHVFAFNAGIRYVKKLLDDGTVGRVISIHAIRTNLGPVRSDVNVLWDLGAHDLSIFNYWLDGEPFSVTASGLSYLSREREDTVIANYLYRNGVMATIYTSWLHPRKVREITVVGEEKMVVWNDMDLHEPVRIYDKGVDQKKDLYTDTFGAFQLTLRDGAVTIPPVRGKEPLATECDHFIECVLERKTPLTDAASGLAVVRALAAADNSIRNNSRSVSLK
ncbi:Gfo/Idh/MocA family oxidoreductase [Acidobacteria bacterium AH-259-L09]|nr:Gfo/Idh/MocA family oxidoreductase [Acidobacteria bacterium AH-259-L09]